MSIKRGFIVSLLCFSVVLSIGISNLLADELPRRVDLRREYQKWGMFPENQGGRSTCSLHVIAGLVEYELVKIEGKREAPLSEEFLLWATTEACGFPRRDGSMFFHIMVGLNSYGVCSEGIMPNVLKFDPDYLPSEKAKAEALARRGWTAHWIKRWDNRSGLSDEQLLEAKKVLASGKPVGVGLLWPHKELMSPLHVMEVPDSRRQVFDGHSVTMVGYRDNDQFPGGGVFLIRNSHSVRWGMDGYGWFPYDYLKKYCNDAIYLERGMEEAADSGAYISFEAEDCPMISSGKNLEFTRQDMLHYGRNLWGGGRQLYCQNPKQGDVFEFTFNVEQAGEYRIDLAFTQAPDYGQLQAKINDVAADPLFDLFCPRILPSGPMTLGTFTLQPGPQKLELTVVGKNPRAGDFGFGFDAIRLLPVAEKAPAAQMPAPANACDASGHCEPAA